MADEIKKSENDTSSSENTGGKAKSAAGSAYDKAKSLGNSASNNIKGGVGDSFDGGYGADDDSSNEVENSFNNGFNNGVQNVNDFKKGYDRLKDFKKKHDAEQAGKAGSDMAKAGQQGGQLAAKGGKAAAKGGKSLAKGAANAAKALGKAFAAALKALIASPVGWLIIGILIFIFVVLMFAYIDYEEDEKNVKEGNYTSEYDGDEEESVKQTWSGVIYQKYSDMSIYAQVDTSEITDGNESVCPSGSDGSYPDTVGGESGIDACSGESFADLSGTALSDIKTDTLYQEGTSSWVALNIKDANSLEDYISVSSGALSLLDEELNDSEINTSQLVKPVYADCMEDFDAFMADSSNDVDGDGKVSLKDCAIRKYNEDGDAVDIKTLKQEDEDGDIVGEFDDRSLYLSYAKSTSFKGNNVENGTAVVSTDENGNAEKTTGQWDYGLGTLAHYVAVYQPSRIANYTVDTVQYLCDGNGNAANGVAVAGCEGQPFGYVYAEEGGVDTSTITSVYSDAYIPESMLYYRQWHKYSEQYLNSGAEEGQVYNGSSGEYRNSGIDKSDWVYEPAVSTGVPQTEVKYVIDKALTFAGEITFDISQDWVTETTAEHTQKIQANTENTNLSKASEAYPSIGGQNTDKVESYALTTYLCYNNKFLSSTAGTYTTGSKLTWYAAGKKTYKKKVASGQTLEGGSTGVTTTTKTEDVYETVKVPAHYEDEGGNVWYKGKNLGKPGKTNKSKENVYSQIKSDDNADAYTWGAKVTAVISIHKQGDLQTYAVSYESSNPDYSDSTRTSYLKQYITNYRTYTKYSDENDVDSAGWTCYEPTTTTTSDGKTITGDLIKSDSSIYSTVLKDIRASDSASQKITALGDQSVYYNGFCFKNTADASVASLQLDKLNGLHYYSMAARMGFTLENISKVANEDIEPVYNNLASTAGNASDGQLLKTLSKVDDFDQSVSDIVDTYSGQYGVDSTLLALIIAEEDASDGNITGAKEGTYTAYNMSTRARTTTNYGGSSKSSDKQSVSLKSILKALFRVKKTSNSNSAVTLDVGAKETFSVTAEQLAEGAIVSKGDDGIVKTSTYNTSTSKMSASLEERGKEAWSQFKAAGYSDITTAAILGNLQLESGGELDSSIVEIGKGTTAGATKSLKNGAKSLNYGIGLAQWTGSRAYDLYAYATKQGKDWTDFDTQIQFLIHETENNSTYKKVLKKCESATTVEEATSIWCKEWEKPANPESSLAKRTSYANTWYLKCAGKTTTTSSTSSSTSSSVTNSYKWDPTDPMLNEDASADGNSLIAKQDRAKFGDGTDVSIAYIDIYPSEKLDDGSTTKGVMVTKDSSGNVIRAFYMSSGLKYKDYDYVTNGYSGNGLSIYSQYYQIGEINNSWKELYASDNHEDWTPISIKLYDSVLIHCVPFTTTSRDSLAEGEYTLMLNGEPASQGCMRLALENLVWLSQHLNSDAQYKFFHGGYDGNVEEVNIDNTASTIASSGINYKSSNKVAANLAAYTGPELSTKVTAMKLQTLQVKYDYNIPMVITAYGLGEDFVDTVLDLYEQQTGVTVESAISNSKDTAWMDYRSYVYNNPDKFDLDLSSVTRTYDYAEKVLSRLTSNVISYQKIDLTYDKDTNSITTKDQSDSDTTKHTFATWKKDEIYDSLADSNTTMSNQNAARVYRAMNYLYKESGENYITEDQWRYLTANQLEYPDNTYDVNDTSSFYDKDQEYDVHTKSLGEDDINLLISRMMRFGTDEAYGEVDYSNGDFASTMISNLLGNKGSSSWSSSASQKSLFGSDSDKLPTYNAFVDEGYSVVRKFGWKTDPYGDREYKDYTTYQDSRQSSNDVYSPFEGTVTETGTLPEIGKYVTVKIDYEENSELYVRIGNLSKISVVEGTHLTVPVGEDTSSTMTVGQSSSKGVFTVSYINDQTFIDIQTVFKYIDDSTEEVSAAAVNGSLEGITISPTGREGMQYAPFTEANSNFNELTKDNPYTWAFRYNGGPGAWGKNTCTWSAWQLCFYYTGIKLPGWGNAITWYESARSDGFEVSPTTPKVGSIMVTSGVGGYGHVLFVAAVDGNRVYTMEGSYNSHYNERWIDLSTYGKLVGFIYTGYGE